MACLEKDAALCARPARALALEGNGKSRQWLINTSFGASFLGPPLAVCGRIGALRGPWRGPADALPCAAGGVRRCLTGRAWASRPVSSLSRIAVPGDAALLTLGAPLPTLGASVRLAA